MQTSRKYTPRALAMLALFTSLGLAGWQLPSLGSAVLAHSGKAVTAVSGVLNRAITSTPAATVPARTTITTHDSAVAGQQGPGKNDVPPKNKVKKTIPGQNVPPANDNCASAITVNSCAFTNSQSTADATDEVSEPQSTCTAQGNSVWYTFTATGSFGANVTINTCGSDFDTAVMVYRVTGAACDFASFVPVACGDDFGGCGDGFQTSISFFAQPGQTYKIQVGGFSSSTGNLVTNIQCTQLTCAPTVVNGNLGTGSPNWPSTSGQQTPARLFRDGVPSDCAAPKACPGPFGAGSFTTDAYTFANSSGQSQCVTVNFEPNVGCNVNVHAIAYLTSYDRSNLCLNYLADSGSSDDLSFSFTVPAGANFVIVMGANNPGPATDGCAYRFTVVGNICQGVVVGPGTPFPAGSEMSDQKAGSVLIYNVYTSGATSGNTQNTRINLTNVNPRNDAFVHLFFVSESCSVADAFICLTANQTTSFLASDLDPGVTGYLVAIAVDGIFGCPTNFNYLIGDEYVKFSTGHEANLGAEAISALSGTPGCDGNSVTAQINFDGISYNMISHVLALDSIGSRADGNDTLLILNRIGGNLGTGAGSLSSVFGIFYDDAETALSFSFNGGHQFRSSLSNNFPRITPRFETFVPAGRTGWFKLWPTTGLWGMTGAAINFNPNSAASAGAFNQGHNLHKLMLTNTANYVVPVFPPSC